MTAAGIEAFGLSDTGRVRTGNEDSFVIAAMRKSVRIRQTNLEPAAFDRLGGVEAHLFVVADGVGGQPGGELASGTAVQFLAEFVSQATQCFHGTGVEAEHEFLTRLEAGVNGIHERIRTEHLADGGPGPATTLTMVVLLWPRAYLVHVGDSRAYYLRRGRLRQITRDQTMGEYMVDLGAWTEEQAARARLAGNLTSVVGGQEMTPAIGLLDLEPGDVLLLCSDGLTRHVPDDRITALLGSPGTAEATCRALVDEANAGGGQDNITVIVVRSAG